MDRISEDSAPASLPMPGFRTCERVGLSRPDLFGDTWDMLWQWETEGAAFSESPLVGLPSLPLHM